MAKYLDDTGLSHFWSKIKALFVPQTRTVNGKALSSNIALTATDVGALDKDYAPPVTLIENTDQTKKKPLRSLDSGTYVLKGYFTSYAGGTESYTFSTGMLVAIVKTTSVSYVQIFYAKGNTVQYLEISDEDVIRNDAKLTIVESTANKVTAIDGDADDYQYPSAKAVYDITNGKLDKAGGTMTGRLILSGRPTGLNDAASKAYVDSKTGGLPTNCVEETWTFALEDGSEVAKTVIVYDASGALD